MKGPFASKHPFLANAQESHPGFTANNMSCTADGEGRVLPWAGGNQRKAKTDLNYPAVLPNSRHFFCLCLRLELTKGGHLAPVWEVARNTCIWIEGPCMVLCNHIHKHPSSRGIEFDRAIAPQLHKMIQHLFQQYPEHVGLPVAKCSDRCSPSRNDLLLHCHHC